MLDIAINPQAVHKIIGEGMPVDNSRSIDMESNELIGQPVSEKGDLFIKFDIQFPTTIADAKREKIVSLLKKNEEEEV